ncbi:MAG: alpha/beta fold hydrolase [Opitutaceae bacterium]
MKTRFIEIEYGFAPKSFATPRGATMSFIDEGPRAESAVLMLHGNPTWSFYYRHLVDSLRCVRRCVAPDHIGMGLSDKPQDYDYTLATRIADIEALVASLGLKQIDLVVHDWGGAIGFGFAARHPEMVRRIVILNTAAFTIDRIPARIAFCKTPFAGPLIVRGFNGFARPATTMAMHRRALTAEEKVGYLFPYGSWADRVAVNAFVQDIPMDSTHPSWPALKSAEHGIVQFSQRPAMIIWGGKDFCFDDAFLARWRKFLPNAEVHRIADAGHYVLEDARDEVVPKIAAFLTRS